MKAWLACLTSCVALGAHAAAGAGDAPPEAALEAKVQVGAFASAAVAEREASKVRSLFSGGTGTEVSQISRDGKTFFRSLVTGFASPVEASAYCDRIKAAGRDCLVRRGARLAARPTAPIATQVATSVTAEAAPEQMDLVCTSEAVQSRGVAAIEIPVSERVPVRYSLDFKRRLMCDHRMCGRGTDTIKSANDTIIMALQTGGATMTIRRADGLFTWTSPSGAMSVGHCEAAPFSDRIQKTKS